MKATWPFLFYQRFCEFVEKESLLASGEKVVVAVSGGVDSMVLLHCLKEWRNEWGLELVLAHLNHQLRGDEADRDEEFVRRVADREGLPCFCDRRDVNAVAEKMGISKEMAARDVRYQFLERIREQVHAHKVAMGHQADDQAETILLRLTRGSGWKGLSGIPVRRGPIIRPLLFASRKEIERFARERGVEFREDSSNFSLEFQRNRIRHEILPHIRKHINPAVSTHLQQFAQIARETEVFLETEALRLVSGHVRKEGGKIMLEIDRLCSYFSIMRKYVLFHLFALAGIPRNSLSFQRMETILKGIEAQRSGRFFHIWQDWYLSIEQKWLVLARRKEIPAVEIPFKPGQRVRLEERGIVLNSEWVNRGEISFDPSRTVEIADAGRFLSNSCLVRSIKPGDWFKPFGLGKKQKISDFFINHKIPISERQKALVLTCGTDIVWLIGYRLDHRFRVTGKTKHVLKLEVNEG